MKEKGMVSIWLGDINNIESLEKYVIANYGDEWTKDPQFFEDFNIEYMETDEDTIEIKVKSYYTNDIRVLLKGCSYDEVIIPRLEKYYKLDKFYNASILVYDYVFDSVIRSGGGFDDIDTVSYLK